MAPETLAVLLAFDTIQFAQEDGHGVMQRGAERIALRSNASYPATCEVLHVLGKTARTDGALLGEMFYSSRNGAFSVPHFHRDGNRHHSALLKEELLWI